MANSINILKEFKENLVRFFDELIEQFPEEGDFVIIRIFLNDQACILDVINYYIKNILSLKPIV